MERCHGFGLVEVMVAMVLGLLLTAAAIQVFLGVRASHQYSRALAEVQNAGRFAAHVLAHDLRLAGYSGCPSALTALSASVAAGSPYGSTRVVSRNALDQGITTNNLLDDAIAAPADQLPGSADADSDALRLSYMRDYGVSVTGSMSGPSANLKVGDNPAGWEAGDDLLVTDCRHADLFTATGVSHAGGVVTIAHANDENADNKLSKAYSGGVQILEPYAAIYYVGDDDGGLYRKQYFAETAFTATYTELTPGVSYLTVHYGVDTNRDRTPDIYRTDTQVEGDDQWDNVITVRVGFIVRSETRVGNEADKQPFEVLGESVTPPDDGHLREVFTITVALRNRLP